MTVRARLAEEWAEVSEKKLTRDEPRDINRKAWYYLNPNSVELIAVEDTTGLLTQTRLNRTTLERMLAELNKPKRRKP